VTRAICALAVVAAVSRAAYADDAIVRGAVVKVEAHELYIDLGSDRGVRPGLALRIKRTIALHHPVTRAPVEDWIPIGSASITQAGAVLSRAVVGELVAEVKPGDVAEVLVIGAPAAVPAAPAPVEHAPVVDPQIADVLAVFTAQAGQPIETRIAAWERYLSTHPVSPYGDAIRHDLDELHAMRDQLHAQTVAQNTSVLATVAHSAPGEAAANAAIPVVFVLDQPEHVASAYLHYRVRGEATYRSTLLAREHEIYLRGTVPADVVQPPGVEYFVEVSTPAGRSGLALGTPEQPVEVDVSGPPLLDRFASQPGRSSLQLRSQYLDFATLDTRAGDHRDRLLAATADFTYRTRGVLESLGVGYGVYAGQGGSADTTWTPDNPIPKSGFDYGYVDAELGGTLGAVHVSLGGQLIAGVGRGGFGMGGEGRVRIGDRDATNLLFSARTIDQVGFLSLVRFGTRVAPRVRFGVSVGATNQPTEGDIGVQLGSDVEIAIARAVSLLVSGSWQGRSVEHAGLGGGAGMGVSW